jgi:hypothetical protein
MCGSAESAETKTKLLACYIIVEYSSSSLLLSVFSLVFLNEKKNETQNASKTLKSS